MFDKQQEITLKCGSTALNEQRNKQNGKRFKAKFRKSQYFIGMLL